MPSAEVRRRSRKDAAHLLMIAFPERSVCQAAVAAEVWTGISSASWERTGYQKRDTPHWQMLMLAQHALSGGADAALVSRLMGAA